MGAGPGRVVWLFEAVEVDDIVQGDIGIPVDRGFSTGPPDRVESQRRRLTLVPGKTWMPWNPATASFPGVPGEAWFCGFPSFPPNSGLRGIGVIDVPPALAVDSCGAVDPAKDVVAAVAALVAYPEIDAGADAPPSRCGRRSLRARRG